MNIVKALQRLVNFGWSSTDREAAFNQPSGGGRKKFLRSISCATLLFVSATPYAQVPTVITWTVAYFSSIGEGPTKVQACQALFDWEIAHPRNPATTFANLNPAFVGPFSSEPGCYMEQVAIANGAKWGEIFSPYSRREQCPANSTRSSSECQCDRGHQEDASKTACVPATPEVPICKSPPAGLTTTNPILPATAEKYRLESDFTDAGPLPLSFSRTYRSTWGSDPSRGVGPLGKTWAHNHSTALIASPVTTPVAVSILSAEGYLRTFAKGAGSSAWTATNSADSLTQGGDGAWIYYRADDDAILNFTAAGQLQTQAQRNGWALVYNYDGAGRLASIGNGFGRMLVLNYDSAGQLVGVLTPDLRTIGYAYDPMGRLSAVTYPDAKSRTFLYENAAFPHALTGIVDESGERYAIFSYDAQGRAVSSELAGSADRYQVSYPSASNASITDPLGTSRTYSYSTTKGKLAVTGGSLPSGTGEADAASRIQDANGLITSETDFKGVTTTTTWDVARRLPVVVEQAAGTPDARIVTTQWHPEFSLPLLVTAPPRSTAYTYDPFGNTLSKTVTEAYTGRTQTWQWTYNAQQLVATATEPNGAVTSYAYDYRGNVLTATNTLGHVTSYTYDNANRVESMTAPNGLVTTYTYDARDRLLTQTVGGQQITMLSYKPYGSVETLVLPNGLILTYTYDAAHRLIGWRNNRGESGSYTLDGMGNRTAEEVKDSTGNVAWNAARVINNLNRPAMNVEGPNQANAFGYDANGELTRVTNGLTQSTEYGLDSLRRVAAITNAAGATATLKYNALDAVTEAKDFKGVMTGYVRDAQGNATSETSADVGTASTQYDALGLPTHLIDALGQATIITRDPLGRPTILVFADGKSTTLRYDQTPASKGYLSEIIDRSGSTEYIRDSFGRVTQKRQTLVNGSMQQVNYEYSPNGLLQRTIYPGGSALTYIYEMGGRLSALHWNDAPLVTDIAWNPLGQPTRWTWAFASPMVPAHRAYDTAGRLVATEFSNYVYDAAGRITSLTQQLYGPGDADPAQSTISMAPRTWTVGYNSLGRITGFDAAGDTVAFGYDANGNRMNSLRDVNGQSISRSYAVGPLSNQLTGFTQTMSGASTSVTYGYNANGDLVSDGLRSYTYDAEGRLAAATTGATDVSPTTRYAHNALGQRVFKTEPLYPPGQGDEADPGFMQSLIAFFTRLWNPATNQAEQLGYAYVYDENGTLISETGSGGANSAGQASYIYLPTANGPVPIAAVIDGATYAVHSDHLNTPRRLSNDSGQAVWQWSYSAFGEDKPTLAKNRFANLDTTPNPGTTSVSEVKFNLRYPGQYADDESGLFYNGFRTYDPRIGGYTQNDKIGLAGGSNRRIYADGNPLMYSDSLGLQVDDPDRRGGPIIPMPTPADGLRELGRAIKKWYEDEDEKSYQTYTRWNPLTGQCYSGRTSGTDTPADNVKKRSAQQADLTAEGFQPGVVDKSSFNRSSIRGREQQMIEINGGAQSSGGTSRNLINGISPLNPRGPLQYIPAANAEFGTPVPSGRCTCQ